MARLALYLLGSPRLERDGEAVPIHRRKSMALLAYLAVTGCSHPREALATLLWPEWDASSARADLRRTLSLVNDALGGSAIMADREMAGLDPDLALWVDVAELQAKLSVCAGHGHAADEACVACVDALEDGVALYRGDFLGGFTLEDSAGFDEWQFFETQTLRDAVAAALARLVTWHAAQSERSAERAIDYARRWLALDSLHEPAHRALMDLYLKAGQRGAALRQYRQCVRVLEEELGAAPSAETTALYERIRTERQLPREPASAKAPELPDQGLRLPSFLAAAEGGDAPEPVFVTREEELARLEGYLAAALGSAGQVAFVTGGAGRGKTALLQAFVRRAMVEHPELLVASGACNAASGVGDPFLPFREVLGMLTGDVEARWAARTITREHARRLWEAMPETLPAFVAHGPHLVDAFVPGAGLVARAEQAGLAGDGWLTELRSLTGRTGGSGLAQQALFQQVTNVLQAVAAKHPLLLLIDDLQWMDQGSVGLLFHLARRLAGCRILVVGAYRPDEVVSVAAADGPSLEKVLAELKRDYGDVWIDLREADAVGGRRFVDAFIDSEPNRLGEGFREALLARTGGHALFTVELLRTLQARGDLVRDPKGAWREEATIDWSALPARVEAVISARLERLDEAERELLTVAAVEGETFTAQVVAQVLGSSERGVLATLSRDLSRQHRLVREAGEVPVDGGFLTRYAFAHALFQEHLYQEMGSGERRLLHGEVGNALEHLYEEGRGRVAVELAYHFDKAGNIRKAVEYGLQAGEHAWVAGANHEADRYYRRTLDQLGDTDLGDNGKSWLVRALKALGILAKYAAKYAESEAYLREGIALGRELGQDPQELAVLYYWLGEALYNQGRTEEVRRVGEEGLALLGDDTRTAGSALMYYIIACAYEGPGVSEHARVLARRMASFLQDLPYVQELGNAYHLCLLLCLHEKDTEGAWAWQDAREQAARQLGDHSGLYGVYAGAARLGESTGDLRAAIANLQLSLENAVQSGSVADRRYALYWLMVDFLRSGHLLDAARCADEVLRINRILGPEVSVPYLCLWVGHIALSRGDRVAAIQAFAEAESLYGASLGSLGSQDSAWHRELHGLGYLACGDNERARRSFTDGLSELAQLRGELSHPEWTVALSVELVGGMDEAFRDATAFRTWLGDYSESHPQMATMLQQWAPEPAGECSVGELRQVVGGFEELSPGWEWEDAFGDCRCTLQEGVEVRAANCRGLDGSNLSAPRLTRRLPEPNGVFVVQTTCEPALADRPGIGGLILWKDKRNFLVLELGTLGQRQLLFRGCLDNSDVVLGRGRVAEPAGSTQSTWPLLLRLEISGDYVDALYSLDDEQWYSVGHVIFPMDSEVQVGFHAIGEIYRTIYHGAYPEGTAIRFTSFKLWA